MHIINQISSLEIRRYCDMKRAIEDLCQRSDNGQVNSICVDNKKILFLCYKHLNIVVMSKMRYSYTSLDEKDLVQKCFCVGCIRHFCQNFCSLFPFADFDFVDFSVNS